MADLVVVVAPDPRFDAVRETLADWCAAGWVRDHCWSVHEDPAREVLRVDADGASGRTLAAIAATERFDRVRLAHLAGLGAPAPGRVFADEVAQRFGTARITRVRALFAGADEPVRVEQAAVGGWHGVIIAPEDGAGPGNAGVAVQDAGDSAVAATLAGLLGLWRGHEASPLDDTPVPSDGTLRLARGYLRRVATQQVEAELEQQVLRLEERLPLPVHAGTATTRIEDVGLASRTMAQQLWGRHGDLLRGPREQVRAAPPKRIGAAEAVRLFLSFVGAALRNAPRRWLQSTLHAVRARTAAVVQDVVFGGGDSAYSVVVGGVTADGRPASWIDQREVSERLAKALEHRVAVQHHAPDDLGAVWQDYVDGALTLADAGERVAQMPPVTIGTRRAVMPSARDIVPGPEARFTDVSPAVTASIGTAEVEAYDLLGSLVLRDRLRSAAAESSIGMPAAEAVHRLEQWRSGHGGSYAVAVGGGIAQALTGLHEEVRTILERLRRAGATGDAAGALQRRQRRLTRLLQILTGAAVLLVAVVVVLRIADAVSLLTAAALIAGVVIAWALSGFVAFFQGQRALFALLNERAQLLSQLDVDERNLVLALRDVRRVSDLYEQFLVWSRIVGAFLDAPLGRGSERPPAAAVRLDGLPLSVATAVAAPEGDAVARAAADLRREVFAAGWLSGPWAAALAAAPGLLGPQGVALADRPEAMFQQRGDADGLLEPWQRVFTAAGVPRSAGDVLWARAARELGRPERDALREVVVGRLVDADGAVRTAAAFLADTAPDAARRGRFAEALLGSSALVERRDEVGTGWVDEVRHGLGTERVLVQLSASMPEWELAGWTEERRDDDDGPDDEQIFGGETF